MQTFTIQEIYNTIHLENPTTGIKFLQYQKKNVRNNWKIMLYKWKLYNTDKKLYNTNGIYRYKLIKNKNKSYKLK